MRRSAVARPSRAGACGLSTTPGGVPNASTATSAPASRSTTASHQPGHWKRTGSAMGTSPDPCSASQVRQAPRACARSSSGSGRSVTGTSVADARQAANPRVSAPETGPDGSSTSITGPPGVGREPLTAVPGSHTCSTLPSGSGPAGAADGQGDGEGGHDDGDAAVEDPPGRGAGEHRPEQPGTEAEGGEPEHAAETGAGGELPPVLAEGR